MLLQHIALHTLQTVCYEVVIPCKGIHALLHVISLVDWPKHQVILLLLHLSTWRQIKHCWQNFDKAQLIMPCRTQVRRVNGRCLPTPSYKSVAC